MTKLGSGTDTYNVMKYFYPLRPPAFNCFQRKPLNGTFEIVSVKHGNDV